MDDWQLVEESRKGNHNAFRQLVLRYEGQVAGTVIGMLGRGPEAEDAGQETFVRFFKALNKFRGDSSVGTYLTRIAINLCLNSIKKNKRRSSLMGSAPVEERGAMDEGQEQWDEKELVQRAIGKLKPEYRTVLVLRLMDGYSTRETAQILKLPQGTVLSRLARGQEQLRRILKPKLGAVYAK